MRTETTVGSIARLVAMLEVHRALKYGHIPSCLQRGKVAGITSPCNLCPGSKLIDVIHAEDAIRQVRLTAKLRILMFAFQELGR